MIIDLRKQKRKIIIEFEKEGLDFELDEFIGKIIPDLRIICGQRKDLPEKTKIEIILE